MIKISIDSREVEVKTMHSFKKGSLIKYVRIRGLIMDESNVNCTKDRIIIIKYL